MKIKLTAQYVLKSNKCTLLHSMYLINARNMEDIKLIKPTVLYGCKRGLWCSTANSHTGAFKQENI
jgi:uncharacterized protein YpiB (UPF0302 family)